MDKDMNIEDLSLQCSSDTLAILNRLSYIMDRIKILEKKIK
jgi:hypothetical protein